MITAIRFLSWTLFLALASCIANATAAATLACPLTHDLSACMEQVAAAGGGTLRLASGTYFLNNSLLLKSNVTLTGAGPTTVITWNPAIARTVNAPLLTATAIDHLAITDVKLVGTLDQRPDSQDLRTDQIGLFLNCAGDPTAGEKTGCNDITLNNVEVENSSDGIHIKGASHLRATDLKLHNNGNTQKDYFHNIYLRRVADVRLIQTAKNRGGFYASPRGHGIRGSHLINVYMSNLEIYDNADYGIHMDSVFNVRLHDLHLSHNCLSNKPGCVAIKCYGPQCDVNEHAPAEEDNAR